MFLLFLKRPLKKGRVLAGRFSVLGQTFFHVGIIITITVIVITIIIIFTISTTLSDKPHIGLFRKQKQASYAEHFKVISDTSWLLRFDEKVLVPPKASS